MSAEQRGPDFTLPADQRARIDRSNSTIGSDRGSDSPSRRPSLDSDRQEPPLSYKIERTRLHTRIAALENALETSENRRQAVIDQYERLLESRDEPSGSSLSPPDSQSRTLLARLVGR
ncbi:hypothetical protein [Natrinema sp. SYSU A 869]|uniref:hypothetical protein n=1 Tax=Natrinema sp. SYSU A 869 TaxID=2871694 RepID=UPI001CA437F9|nr:hypothetical protein [Natrinema sp. SYSU A 869]